jgi:spore coat protein JC
MWSYEKRLEYPIKIKNPNPARAKCIITQYGGPDGELGAALRYLTQRYSMPTPQAQAVLTDIGTEELAHLEMVATIVHQLMKNSTLEEIKEAGMGGYYADHDKSLFYIDGAGNPWTAAYIQSKGDPIADLTEDLAAEQKARATYEYLIQLSADEPDVVDPLRFLREREVVHFQRFGEALQIVQDYLATKKMF